MTYGITPLREDASDSEWMDWLVSGAKRTVDRLNALRSDLESAKKALEHDVARTSAEVRQALEMEQKRDVIRRRARGSSAARQGWGTVLVLLGVALSTVPSAFHT